MAQIFNMLDFGHAIRSERKARKLRQEDLARMAGITRVTVINVEQGNDMSLFTAMKILRAMGACLEIHPVAPDFTKLGELLDET